MGRIRNQVLVDQIALRIKQIREAKGVTLEVFYNDTSIHLARIETGKVNLTVSTLEAVCNYFQVSLTEFFSEGWQQTLPENLPEQGLP